jgi:peptide/nickel transport system permease protein
VTLAYVLRRIGVFFLVVILAVTINFLIPRLRSTNPVEARMNEFAQQGGGNAANMKQLIAIYNEKFGLDKPLWEQYLTLDKPLWEQDVGLALLVLDLLYPLLDPRIQTQR